MDTSHELDPGLTEEPEYITVDREETTRRPSALKSYIIVTLSFGLLCIVLIFLRLMASSIKEREPLMSEVGDLTHGWHYFNQSLYFISTTKRNWTASRDYCLQRKADLVVINSREEQGFVSRFRGPSWIGLSGQDIEGTCEWVDGTNMTSSWRRSEPRDGGGVEGCVVALDGSWSEEPCDRLHHGICEKVTEHLEAALKKEVMAVEEEAPSITEFHSSATVLPVGHTARFSCDAGGTPEPTVEWLHDGRPLERDGTDHRSEPAAWVERGFLFVRGVSSGVHTVCCMVSNSAGTTKHTAELIVFDACELTLDPNTANRELSLSEDNRKVTRVREDQSYPDHPERFDIVPQVLCGEALIGHCYWEVEWKSDVVIGVAYRRITRSGEDYDSWIGASEMSWGVNSFNGRYTAMHNGSRVIIHLPHTGSDRVGVYLDRPAGTLSFYRVSPDVGGSSDTLTHIHTFRSTFTQEDLLPGFRLWGAGSSVSLHRV